MNVNIFERKTQVTADVKHYAEKKCGKLAKYFGGDPDFHITFAEERGLCTAEITIQYSGIIFRAQERTSDHYASIDGAVASLDRQIQKNKTRLAKRIRQASFDKILPAMEDYHDEEYDVLRVKPLDVKPMTTEDAILQMNLLSHSFFFFKNSEQNESYCVVYKRANGGYGMLVAGK